MRFWIIAAMMLGVINIVHYIQAKPIIEGALR